jgi:ParB family chromosome partitioning protein
MPTLERKDNELDAMASKLKLAEGELAKADDQLKAFEGATPVRPIDPKLIRRSKWANRAEDEFNTDEYAELKAEIEQAGGNVQPILVRVSGDGKTISEMGLRYGTAPGTGHYEIVYGHRRHRACLELGLPVNAQIATDLDDRALFAAMDRENRSRKNLSPWEQGRMYQAALDEGLFSSLRKLCESVGADSSNATKFIRLAKLPAAVLNAFVSPLELQARWARPLSEAVEKDPDAVMRRAAKASEMKTSVDAATIFAVLIGREPVPTPTAIPVEARGKKIAVVRVDAKGRTTVEIAPGGLSADKISGLAKLLADYAST